MPVSTDVNPVTEGGRLAPKEYDAILLASFGGPEGQDDVIPFLRNVTRGRGIPDERLEEVSHHYRAFGGVSPINAQNRALKAALEAELAARGIDLPVYWGNRNWDPYIPETLERLYDAGHRRLLMLTTSAYTCYSSCRQYREDIGMALAETGLAGRLEVDKVRQYFDHPGFVAPFVEGATAGLARVREALGAADGSRDREIRVLFSTHSIPTRDAEAAGRAAGEPREFEGGSAYVAQHLANARAIMGAVAPDLAWDLVYQSRSGAPHVPWLEPDINDHLASIAAGDGKESAVKGVVIVPLGFVSDHMEVAWDLDTEALETCMELGIEAVRVPTPGTHPIFVSGLVDLVSERLPEGWRGAHHIADRPHVTELGPWYDVVPAGDCENFRGAKPAIAEAGTAIGSGHDPYASGVSTVSDSSTASASGA
ncbi:ferrochelatase [Sinomonas sp. ASV322]|uniref:ferrochelatase n=1 Tax=Sinomonas sp. ASV322 TaxID=3041920 RepID=UPI0027DD05BF|nr:ferrochelatase [Sinomonas sp. ASV322]MDQ4503321.1 ferrochelatase [Sinomonas sp. ASV322]